jgi:hypothetical protein
MEARKMAMYVFYLVRQNGCSPSFEAFELSGDEAAPETALKLLGEHPGCAYVAVWEGDRQVFESRHPVSTAMAG